MITEQRVFFSDNGVLTDLSKYANNLFSSAVNVQAVAGEDYLYIASDLPLTHRYFQISSGNAATATSTVEIWDGNTWESAVDVIDYTDSSGVPLAESGWLRFTVDRNGSWGLEDTTEDITGLTTIRVYKMYWFRLSWSQNVDFDLNYIGYKFCEDSDLKAQYSDLLRSSVIEAWEAGKTSWDEQHILASEEIVRMLRKKDIIVSGSQILDYQQFTPATVHKVAEMIYAGFGDDYVEDEQRARKRASESFEQGIYKIDRDGDGRKDQYDTDRIIGIRRS